MTEFTPDLTQCNPRYECALADLNQAISLDRTHLNAWSNRVIILTKLARWTEVISDCTQIIELDPNSLQAYNSRGKLDPDFNLTSSFTKDYHDFDFTPGVAHHMIGNNVMAECDLTIVVGRETVNMVGKGRALGARAAVYCATKKWNLAVEDCQRARVLDPQGSERYKLIQQSAREAADIGTAISLTQAKRFYPLN